MHATTGELNAAWSALLERQRLVARRVLDEEGARRRHLIVSLSGAHAYGFPSPDSDLDLKAVHVVSTEALLGFPRVFKAAERLEVVDGVEIDYSSNELGVVLQGVLKGNGNYVERFLSGYALVEDSHVAELRQLVRGALSRRLHRHYAGFAMQQRGEFEKSGRRSAKKLLYVLRTTLTGAHVLRSGDVVTDLTRLAAEYGFADALELVEQKRRGEKAELPDALAARWPSRVDAAFGVLERAHAESALPEDPPNERDVESWLVAFRRSLL